MTLEATTGAIVATGWDEDQLPKTFWIVPTFKPRTHEAEVVTTGYDGSHFDEPCISIVTDAAVLLIEERGHAPYIELAPRNHARCDFPTHREAIRVTALYSDGTDELVLDYDPALQPHWPASRWAALLLVLALSGSQIRRAVPV